jgi:hypothetical protein
MKLSLIPFCAGMFALGVWTMDKLYAEASQDTLLLSVVAFLAAIYISIDEREK